MSQLRSTKRIDLRAVVTTSFIIPLEKLTSKSLNNTGLMRKTRSWPTRDVKKRPSKI